MLLLDDLGALDAADHLDGLSFVRVERVIDALAKFHAWAWNLRPETTRASMFPALADPVTVGLYTMGVQHLAGPLIRYPWKGLCP